ncbi:MAG: O-antigen ligase family protein [Polaribacter sp.]|uniref:O-antigen ligase family protein n=1 Tax=Polaribacter sp. TaxID=1920175 RepID=UPI003EF752B1
MMSRLIFIVAFFSYSGFYAVLAIVISLGLTSSSRSTTIPIRVLTTLLMGYGVFYFFKKYDISKEKKTILFLFLLFWSLYFIKVLFHENSLLGLSRSWFEYMFYAINFCILPFLMFSVINFSDLKKTILNSFIFSGFLMGIFALYFYKDILMSGVGRISLAKYSDFDEQTLSPLALSYAGALTLMLCIFEIIYNKTKTISYKLYLYFTITLSLIMFFLGASRGSLVAIVLTVPLFVIYGSAKNKFKFFIAFLLSIPILVWGAIKTGSSIFSRTAETAETGDSGRGFLWNQAITEFSNYPVVGGRIEFGIYPHNFILEILMATGIVGAILIFPIIFGSFKRINRLVKLDKDYIWVYIIFIQGFAQHCFTGAIYFAVLMFLPLGIIYSEKR